MKPTSLCLMLAVVSVPLLGSNRDPVTNINSRQQRQMQLDLQAEQVRLQREQLEFQERQARQTEEQRQDPLFLDEVARRRGQANQGRQIQDQAVQDAIAEDKARRDFERQKELIQVRAQAETQARTQAEPQARAQAQAEANARSREALARQTQDENEKIERELLERQFVRAIEESYARMEKRYPDFAEGGKHFEKFQEFLVKNAPATLGDMSQANFPEVYAEKYAALVRVKPRE